MKNLRIHGTRVLGPLVFSRPATRHLATVAFGALIGCATVGNAAGATCTVNGAGGAQFTTIQAAVNDATCAQINVAAGTYNEHVTIARDVTVSGAGAASTIVDGTNSGRVFTIDGGVVLLSDLTVQHGKTEDGSPASDCTDQIFCLEFAENGAPGAGILNAGSLTILRVMVRDNQTGKGGNAGNINCPNPDSMCESFGGNGGEGAGISNEGALTISASMFLNNATGTGGVVGTVTCDPFALCSAGPGAPAMGARSHSLTVAATARLPRVHLATTPATTVARLTKTTLCSRSAIRNLPATPAPTRAAP
jgi:hypothetical protein